MKILIFLLCVSRVLAQEITCNYVIVNSTYTCDLSINNPSGFDGFMRVHGEHHEGRTNNDVIDLRLISGNSAIIPQIICQQFLSLRRFTTTSESIGIHTISGNSFKDCTMIEHLTLLSPIRTINLNAFQNNAKLQFLRLQAIEMTTLPAELLRNNPNLREFVCFHCRLLSDLPSNFYQANSQLESIWLSSTALNILRPEWHQNLSNLEVFRVHISPISELPRNSFRLNALRFLDVSATSVRQLDYFAINSDNLRTLFMVGSPIEAIDFNIIDRAKDFTRTNGMHASWRIQQLTG